MACGWKWYRWGHGGDLHLLTPHHDWSKGSMVPAERIGDEPFRSDSWPDYLNDLNACHEMEETLKEGWQWCSYYFHLRDVTKATARDGWIEHGPTVATAAQRCKAFLRTIGKWVE